MDLTQLIAAMTAIAQAIPVIGPYLPTVLAIVTTIVTLGAIIATVLPAPKPGANAFYRVAYDFVQWCALNKGQGINLTSPKVNGLVAGPSALSEPAQAVSSIRVPEPIPVTPGAVPVVPLSQATKP